MGFLVDVLLDEHRCGGVKGIGGALPLPPVMLFHRVSHFQRLGHGFTFRDEAEPGAIVRSVADILHARTSWLGLV
jgi:hypothetical protein